MLGRWFLRKQGCNMLDLTSVSTEAKLQLRTAALLAPLEADSHQSSAAKLGTVLTAQGFAPSISTSPKARTRVQRWSKCVNTGKGDVVKIEFAHNPRSADYVPPIKEKPGFRVAWFGCIYNVSERGEHPSDRRLHRLLLREQCRNLFKICGMRS